MSWYPGGLRFACTQCGDCCTGTPGYVWIAPADETAIAAHLDITRRQFRKRYTRLVNGRMSLVEQASGACIFLDEQRRCSIQDVKPRQCVAFPFWPRITASKVNWRLTAQDCPGMNHGATFSTDEVDTISNLETPREVVWQIFRQKRD